MTDEKTEDQTHPEVAVLCRLPYEEAVLMAGLLNNEGIESRVEQDYPNAYPVPATVGVAVLVPADKLEEAQRIRKEQVGE